MSRLSLLQFHSEKRDSQNVPLHWPGTPDGFPFRGNRIPDLKGGEINNLPYRLTFRSRRFCLWEEQDKRDFDMIKNHMASGLYLEYKRHDQYIESKMHWVIWLEWAEVAAELPSENMNAYGRIPS